MCFSYNVIPSCESRSATCTASFLGAIWLLPRMYQDWGVLQFLATTPALSKLRLDFRICWKSNKNTFIDQVYRPSFAQPWMKQTSIYTAMILFFDDEDGIKFANLNVLKT